MTKNSAARTHNRSLTRRLVMSAVAFALAVGAPIAAFAAPATAAPAAASAVAFEPDWPW